VGFAWRVAVRFLAEGRFQTVLLVLGVAAGVAVVTYITALVEGLQDNTIRRTLGVQPHLTIRPVKDVPLAAGLGAPPATAAGATTAPGSSVTAPGSSTTAPGSSTTAPGSSVTAPGSSTTAPGSSTTAPGPSVTAPGSSATAPGSSTTVPGPSATGPGRTDVAVAEQPRAQRTRSIDNWQPLLRMLEVTPGVVAVSPMAAGAALAQRGEGSRAIALIGIELDRYDRIAALSDKIVAGVARLAPGEAIIGQELAEDLGVQLGDRFTVALGRDTTDSMRAVGIYDAGVRDVNRRNVYVPLRTAQSLLGIPGGVTNLDVTVAEVFAVEDVARRLRARLPFEIESWIQANRQLLSALNAQTMSTRLIRLVVLLVVVLGIASVLVVSVVQKRKEIGILRAMGASRAQMTRVFLLQGALVSAAGSVAGAALAWVMVAGFTALVRGADGGPLFPIVLDLRTFAWVALVATVCGVLAAVAPARRAAQLDPAQAIRL
jgi:lipoprotein-releasing system permease protein